jgi:hypothetical protein
MGQYKCVDAFEKIYYTTRQLINGLWYLYNQSGYVVGTFAKEEITFNE